MSEINRTPYKTKKHSTDWSEGSCGKFYSGPLERGASLVIKHGAGADKCSQINTMPCSVITCATMGMSLCFSVPQIPYVLNKIIAVTPVPQGYVFQTDRVHQLLL